ncbi:MAG TPA: hypothetical protein VFW23_08475 [Tepidisphaeraceae bacterium]|nr:hypothetical protein [Tepidisphaeraceae bacterium]
MAHSVITGLSADLLPHRNWTVSRWFYANPIWYYHRRSAAHEIRPDGRFYKLVDPALRDVCRLLNDAGLRTTPSCEGHSYPRERFERIWEELKREEPLIRGDGLVVKDCENDEAFLFRQSDYQIAWPSFDDFFREASAHQNVGYLGILVPDDRPDLAERFSSSQYTTPATRLRADEPIGTLLGGLLFEVRVETTDAMTRAAEWRAFTRHVPQMLVAARAVAR